MRSGWILIQSCKLLATSPRFLSHQILQISFTPEVPDPQLHKAAELQLACFEKPDERSLCGCAHLSGEQAVIIL